VTDSITRSGISFLPGSLDEIKNISNIAATKSLESTVYSGKEGSEYNYKLLSGKNIPIMHISTHGFSLGHNTIQEYNDPMRRCGLLMSGSLEAWNGNPRPNMEDGILLGEEIANVRLRNNELVVLSACESALGVTTSEGVWGLQRSFKKAGGKTILMSLWKVSDLATTLLMNTFYENLFSGCSKHESLRNAQHYVKEFEDDNGNKPFESPYYWAAWILLDALN
jgi:CHAT domain-containing protein